MSRFLLFNQNFYLIIINEETKKQQKRKQKEKKIIHSLKIVSNILQKLEMTEFV